MSKTLSKAKGFKKSKSGTYLSMALDSALTATVPPPAAGAPSVR